MFQTTDQNHVAHIHPLFYLHYWFFTIIQSEFIVAVYYIYIYLSAGIQNIPYTMK